MAVGTSVFIVGITAYISVNSVVTNDCGGFRIGVGYKQCFAKYGITLVNATSLAYDFGWGDITRTKQMCGERNHLRALNCVRSRVAESCRGITKAILFSLLDMDRQMKATQYICNKHNLDIFYKNMPCLLRNRNGAGRCSQLRLDEQKKSIAIVSRQIRKSPSLMSRLTVPFEVYLRQFLHNRSCIGFEASMDCLFDVLRSDPTCDEEVLNIVLKYFSELQKKNCNYTPPRRRQPLVRPGDDESSGFGVQSDGPNRRPKHDLPDRPAVANKQSRTDRRTVAIDIRVDIGTCLLLVLLNVFYSFILVS